MRIVSLLPAGTETLAAGGERYTLNTELLQELSPDVVITQRLCDVCAISGEPVARALGSLPRMPEVVELSPNCLEDIFTDIRRIAETIGAPENGIRLVTELRGRGEVVRSCNASAPRPVCFLMEWIDPPYCSGPRAAGGGGGGGGGGAPGGGGGRPRG